MGGQDEDVYVSAMDNGGDYLSETDYLGDLLTNAALELSPGGSTLVESECIDDPFDLTDSDYETFANIDPPTLVISSTERVVAEYLPDFEAVPSLTSSATSVESMCSSTTIMTKRGTPRKPKMYENDIPSDDPKRQKRILNAKKAKMNREEKKRKEREQEQRCKKLERVNKLAVIAMKRMNKTIENMKKEHKYVLDRERTRSQEMKKLRELLLSTRTKIEMTVELSDPDSRIGKALSTIALTIPEHIVKEEEAEFSFIRGPEI